MLEWLKRHAWKACKPLKGFAGSNPAFSAKLKIPFLYCLEMGFLYLTTYFFLSVDGCDNRKLLITAANSANPAPTNRQVTAPLSGEMIMPNNNATIVVPVVCPNSRAIPNIPLAPPERLDGAEDIIVPLLGV